MKELLFYIFESLKGLYSVQEINVFTQRIMEHVCHIPPYQLLFDKDREISVTEKRLVTDIVERLKSYEPIQYVLGKTEFFGHEFKLNSSVLIPRPETEELVGRVIDDYSGKEISVVDLGTGSGCIAVTLALHLKDATIIATDISEDALTLARRNAHLLNAKVEFAHADMLDVKQMDKLIPFGQDVIISNPPYVKYSEIVFMDKNVVDYEPEQALFVSDEDPLLFYKAIARLGKRKLRKGGRIYCEINTIYGNELIEMFKKERYKKIEVFLDMSKRDRFIKAEL